MLFGLTGSRITILMYHSIDSTPDRYSIHPDAFRRQIQLIQRSYPVVALKDIATHLLDDSSRRVVVTFDDAFEDFSEFAYPVLLESTVPATVFVPTRFMGGFNTWDEGNSESRRRRVMSAGRVRELSGDPLIDWGSHTVDHIRMRGLSHSEMRRQAEDSRYALEDVVGRPITMFSYPYGQRGDVSRASEQVLLDAGYTAAVTTFWGTRNFVRGIHRLRRIWLDGRETDRALRAKIDGWCDWRIPKEAAAHAYRQARSWSRRTRDADTRTTLKCR